jgi:DNA-binding NarL/FixJ family response regulator
MFERLRWLVRARRASSSTNQAAAVLDNRLVALGARSSVGLEPTRCDNHARPEAGEPLPVRLTRREIEILLLLAQRYTNREIADDLVLSVRTVERHINNLFNKTGLTCRREARDYCRQHRLVPRG